MKRLLLILSFAFANPLFSQSSCENIFIISTDGMRWQEIFNGADSALLFNTKYVKDTATLPYLYWDASLEERRKKLMPFTWNYIAKKGQLWVTAAFPTRFPLPILTAFLTQVITKCLRAMPIRP
jgi:hypothetical protein